MRSLTSFLFLIIVCKPGLAQCDNSIVGKWGVVSMFNGEVYFNLETDSTFLSETAKQKYPDTTAQKQFVQNAKFLFGTTVFDFRQNGLLILDMTSIFQDTIRYCYNSKKGTIQYTSKDSFNRETTDTFNVTFKHGLLCFRFREIDAYYDVELERIE